MDLCPRFERPRRRTRAAAPPRSSSRSSRRCCSIPHADLILDANPAACTLLGYDRALLRQTKVSALHAGQLPALIVFTQAVLDKGAYWTNALTPRHATGQTLRLEYAGSLCRATAARWCCSP